MAKYHINRKGEAGQCRAAAGNCPFGGDEAHFSTPEAAREAYEGSQSTFAVVIKRSDADAASQKKRVRTPDADLGTFLVTADKEYKEAEDKQDWLEAKVNDVARAQHYLDVAPGGDERARYVSLRNEARTRLLAADLVAWRNSPFYSESVEERMKTTAVVISDADESLDAALSDEAGQRELAARLGLGHQDVTRILELTQDEYQRPRAPRSRSIGELSEDPQYASYTAYAFRIPEENVQEVLKFASKHSSLTAA